MLSSTFLQRLFVPAVLLAAQYARPVLGQSMLPDPPTEGPTDNRVVIPELARPQSFEPESTLRVHTPRPWLFGMPARSLDDRVWFSSANDPPGSSDGVDGDERFQVYSGWDNPYFDFIQRGDTGGVGYEKLYAQMLLTDYGRGSCLLNCQATEPAGMQFGGMPTGPTVVSPSFSWFHDLAGGVTFQTFVGASERANLSSVENLDRNVQYGLALQSPLPLSVDSKQFFLFVEALGRSRPENITGQMPAGGWDLLPGISWQSSQRCWITGGVLVPFGGGAATGLWHITCSWNF